MKRVGLGLVAGALLAAGMIAGAPAPRAAAGDTPCDFYDNVISLGVGESFNGTSKRDVIYGAGENIINGNGGNDVVCVEGTGSVVHGNSGNDALFTVFGGSADLYGDSGSDNIVGEYAGAVHGGSGNDYIEIYSADAIYGDGGNDYIWTQYTAYVSGGGNNDYIFVYESVNVDGDSGSDDITAVYVEETLDCGSGRDSYFVEQALEVVRCENPGAV